MINSDSTPRRGRVPLAAPANSRRRAAHGRAKGLAQKEPLPRGPVVVGAAALLLPALDVGEAAPDVAGRGAGAVGAGCSEPDARLQHRLESLQE